MENGCHTNPQTMGDLGQSSCICLLGKNQDFGEQDLQRHLSFQSSVSGELAFAHPADADPGDDPIVREGFADHSALRLYHLRRTIGSERASGSKAPMTGLVVCPQSKTLRGLIRYVPD